jgi:hypothetical protein
MKPKPLAVDDLEQESVPFGTYSNLGQLGFKKHHQLIVMKPAPGYTISLVARKLYNAMLAHTQQRIERFGIHKASESMECHLSELMQKVGIKTGSYELVKKYIAELEHWKVKFESPNNSTSSEPLEIEGPVKKTKKQKFVEQRTDFGFMHMLASCRLMADDKDRYFVRWSFASEVYEYFEMLNSKDLEVDKQYVYINLEAVSALGTYASLVLYEICSKFKGINRTGEKSNDWWQASLTGKSLGETKREWRKFKSETIGPAILEINSLTDIHVTLEENRSAQTCYFTIAQKQKEKPGEKQPEFDAELIEKAKALSINESKILKLLKEFGEPRFRAELITLRTRIENTSLAPLRSNYAFLKICLENANQKPLPLVDRPTDKPEMVTNVEFVQIAKQSIDLETDQIKQEAEVRKQILDQLKKEPKQVVKEFLLRAKEELMKKGQNITPKEHERIEEGSWTPGMVGSAALALYANEQFGADWKQKNFVSVELRSADKATGEIVADI